MVIQIILPLSIIYWLLLTGGFVHEVWSGILVAVGKQKIATIVNLCGYWLVGIPLAVIGFLSNGDDDQIKVIDS